MRSTNKELKRHIIYEFYAGLPNKENILNESRGVVSGLHKVVTALCNEMESQVLSACAAARHTNEVYSGELKKFGLASFFKEYRISLSVSYDDADVKYSGGLSIEKSFIDTKNGVVCLPDINLYVSGNNPSKIMRVISFCLGHELTHAYNLFEYARKNGLTTTDISKSYDKQRYMDIIAAKTSPGLQNERAVGHILYNLNRMERNAYIAQLKQELESVADRITDSKSAWHAVLNSESYKKFQNLENNINLILSPDVSDIAKSELIHYTNRTAGKNFKSYEQLQRFYARYWETWKKKYLTMAAKVAYDVFEKHNHMTDGNMSEDFLIKP